MNQRDRIAVLTSNEVQLRLQQRQYPAQSSYKAMYSTWFDGITTDPTLMTVPVDDHLVHRGDGVFEAIKVIKNKIFLLDAHLARLENSARSLSIPLPYSIVQIKQIILETLHASQEESAILRLFVSRGPGFFTTNPYDSIGSQMYLIVTSFAPIAPQKYELGVNIGVSAVPAKDSWMAQIKSCNYLPNVMMKKESVDRKLDFTIGVTAEGFITEGGTENIVILDSENFLFRPKLNNILKGTTMTRTFELSEKLQLEGIISGVREKDLTLNDIQSAQEAFMIGTTLDVLPVVTIEGRPIGTGQVGTVGKKLLALLREDILSGPHSVPAKQFS